jgi:hypothetical protein
VAEREVVTGLERVLKEAVLSHYSGISLQELIKSNGNFSHFFFIILKRNTYIQERPRQCPSGPLWHILINILFYHNGHPAMFEYIS